MLICSMLDLGCCGMQVWLSAKCMGNLCGLAFLCVTVLWVIVGIVFWAIVGPSNFSLWFTSLLQTWVLWFVFAVALQVRI